MMNMKLCPKCGSLAFFNSYFQKWMCNTCEHQFVEERVIVKLPKFGVIVNLVLRIGAAILVTFGMVAFSTNNVADAIFFVVVAIYALSIKYPDKYLT